MQSALAICQQGVGFFSNNRDDLVGLCRLLQATSRCHNSLGQVNEGSAIASKALELAFRSENSELIASALCTSAVFQKGMEKAKTLDQADAFIETLTGSRRLRLRFAA